MRFFLSLYFLAGFALSVYSQNNYSVSEIDPAMLKNADAVIRDHTRIVEVEDIDKITEKTYRVVSVLNEAGETYVRALEFYDESSKIKEQEAIIYDKNGKEINKIKSRDFKDQSNFDSFILFSDNRVSYLDYTPREYPYTIAYTSEVVNSNTIFISDWVPVEGYDVSVENSSFKLVNPEKIPLRYVERNTEHLDLKSKNSAFELEYNISGLPAYDYEKLSPNFQSFSPRLLMALNDFNLEGVRGHATNWQQFGKWMYGNLVAGHDKISSQTVSEISSLTQETTSLEEKARIIYNYVQKNTRYVAVMYGIGGWEPVMADEVDRMGYGDCKGLTNYTKALLKTQGIESYYSVVYGGNKRDIDPEFAKMQGNHVILNIPVKEGEDIWLECTSQKDPFNYLGKFTDDRYVLRLKPEGGEIVKTHRYSEKDNIQKTSCKITLKKTGDFSAEFERTSYGVPYGEIYWIEDYNEKNQKEYYREEWPWIHNLDFNEINFVNDKREIEFREDLDFNGSRLAIKAGNRLLLPLSFIQKGSFSMEKDEDRKMPVKIGRGRSYEDEFIFVMPEGFDIESIPESEKISSEFGEYSINISSSNIDGVEEILVRRNMIIREGEWEAQKYEEFRNFIKKINQLNNLKAVIVQSNT